MHYEKKVKNHREERGVGTTKENGENIELLWILARNGKCIDRFVSRTKLIRLHGLSYSGPYYVKKRESELRTFSVI